MNFHAGIAAAMALVAFAVPPPERPAPPRVFAHYMPWFQAEPTEKGILWDHWQWFGKGPKHDPDRILDNGRRDIASVFYPSIGPYDSRDPAVLEYHLLTAKASGIEGFIADWYGSDNYPDTVFGLLLKAAERCGMKVAICLEEKTFFPGFGRTQSRAEAQDVMEFQVRYALDRYAVSPAYLRHGARPVFFIFNGYGTGAVGPGYLSPEEVGQVLGRFEAPGILLVRGWHDPAYEGAVPGCYAWATSAEDRAKFYSGALAARAAGRLEYVVGVANPGFDDTPINGWGHGPRVNDRRGTQEYEDNWAEVLRHRPDAVQVVTWNDFQEGTTVEPTEEYGLKFLDLTERFAARFAGRPVNLKDNGWPLRLYRLRKRVEALPDEADRAAWTARLDDYAAAFSEGRRFLMGWRLGRLEAAVPPSPD